MKGETAFRWLPAGFFLEQRMSLNFLGTEIESLELIGYDPETGTFPSTVFSNLSGTPSPTGGRSMATCSRSRCPTAVELDVHR
ncbi:MAG TPA: hypothetical protein VFT80_09985 [Actinomycetota bacterium]|nr:hypothetical protein [Actinomycetota bacterium]